MSLMFALQTSRHPCKPPLQNSFIATVLADVLNILVLLEGLQRFCLSCYSYKDIISESDKRCILFLSNTARDLKDILQVYLSCENVQYKASPLHKNNDSRSSFSQNNHSGYYSLTVTKKVKSFLNFHRSKFFTLYSACKKRAILG